MKKASLFFLLSISLFALALSCCLVFAAADEGKTISKTYVLPVFETSDIHGYLADISADQVEYRLAYIADKVKDARTTKEGYDPSLALLVDGGDIFQGNSLSNLLEGASMSAAFEMMDYDAVTVGNHEFDWGIEKTIQDDATLPDYETEGGIAENSIPVVVSNMYKDGEKVSFAYDYVIVKKQACDASGNRITVKIAIIGFADEYSSSILASRFKDIGYTIDTDYSKVNALAEELESTGQCDATVVITHGEASYAAGKLGGSSKVDLVLGGHTHSYESGRASSGIAYAQPSGYAQSYAYAELVFRMDDGQVCFITVENCRTFGVTSNKSLLYKSEQNADELDEELVELTDHYIEKLSYALDKEIGYITVPATRYDYLYGSGERSCTAGNWICSIVARSVGADIAFENSGGIRLDFKIDKGKKERYITVSDVYTMFPFSNAIYLYRLTYLDLLKVFEYSMTSDGQSLLSRMTGIDCYFTGGTVDSIIKDGEPVYLNGEWQEGWPNRSMLVAVNEYIATSDRSDGGMHNPFVEWNNTPRLISCELIDNEAAVSVLTEEAAVNGGHLYISTATYFHEGRYVYVEPDVPDPVDDGDDTRSHDGQKGLPVDPFFAVLIAFTSLILVTGVAALAILIIKRLTKR